MHKSFAILVLLWMLATANLAQAFKTRIHLEVSHAYTMDRMVNAEVRIYTGEILLASGFTDISGKISLKIKESTLVNIQILYTDSTLITTNFNLYVKDYSFRSTMIKAYPKLSTLKDIHAEEDALYGARDAGDLFAPESREFVFGCKKTYYQDAVFAGNSDLWEAYYASHLRYPMECRLQHIQGTVEISFIVEENGRISHLCVDRHPNELLAAEALRVVMDMPWWQPATCDGEPIRSIRQVTIQFILN